MSNKLSFLDGQSEGKVEDNPNVAVEPVATQAAEPASASPEPAQAQQSDQAAIDAKAREDRERDPETGKFVPPGLLEERKRRQAAEAEARELREFKQRYEQERLQQQNQYQPPLVTEDAEGWAQDLEARQVYAAYNQKLDTSEMLVRQQFGDEPVEKASDAFLKARDSDPTLQQKFDQQKHPYSWLLNWHKQHELISEIGSDPEAWRNAERERIRQELLGSQKTASVSQQSAPYQPPPPSLAAAPVAARPNSAPHVGPGAAFDRAIPR